MSPCTSWAPHIHTRPTPGGFSSATSPNAFAFVTDAKVLQEILHRYVALDRRDAIQPAFDALLGVVDEMLPVDAVAVERAKRIISR
jgi:uncharacterized protein